MTNEEIVTKIVDETINPLLATHGGKVSVNRIEGATCYITLEGGCQGCARAKQTLKHFVEQVITTKLPVITSVVDVTNHDEGKNPYYKPEECCDEEKD